MNAPTIPTLPLARRRQRGFSLPEMLVASAVFMFVMIAAYQAFQRSQESYRLGQNQAEMVQAARVAFEQMSNDVRLAGFEFDLDGEKEGYPGQPDEPIEFMHRRAIVVRANYDFDKEFKGREPGLEFEGQLTACCPIVTTENEEIVGFALGKPSGTLPTGTITFKADTTGTLDPTDEIRRNAYVESDGDIVNEETVTIGNVELLGPGDSAYAPPYTLYRFQLKEDGTISRQPYIDNVYSLEFTYYDDSGTEIIGPNVPGTQATWGDDNGKDKEAGRATRWNVRRVAVKVETITPDTDLRLKARGTGTGVRNFQGRRMFTLDADIFPPNLGRRGARDRDINPPEPPRNVEVCTGECNWVRVSWDPGPPEDRVTDHVVTLCEGGPCEEDLSNFVASFIQTANFDVQEMQEYLVFTSENSPEIVNGLNLWARVVARNAAGTESECLHPSDPDNDCPTCCNSQAGAIVGERCRPDSFESAVGGGYDPTHASFPDAAPDNSTGMPIVTVATSPYFPPSLESRVTASTPRWALNRSAAAGTAPDDWTTKDLGGGVAAAITCHRQESTPVDANSDLRTPFEAFWKSRPNTYVWRASAGDASSWGGANNVRSFLPTADNLHDFVQLDLLAGSANYVETSNYVFQTTGQGDYYDGVGELGIGVTGHARPVQAVTPCEIYYYRFRATSLCWDDREGEAVNGIVPPPDGVGVLDAGGTMNAWDTDTIPSYRAKSKSISPFYPPLLNQGDTAGDRDRPDQGTHDSDSHGGASSLDTYAIPAYNLPQRVVDAVTGAITGWVKPEAPSEFYLTRVDEQADPMQGLGDASLYDARLIFNAARRTAPAAGEGPAQSAAFRTFRIYRKAASGEIPGETEFDFTTANPALFAEFDTLGPNDVRHYTMAGDGLVPGPATFAALRDLASDWASTSPDADCSLDPDTRPPGTTCVPYIYWLKTAQCTKFDDGIDTTSAELSDASRPFVFPCNLTYDVMDIQVTPGTAAAPPNVVRYTPVIEDADGDPKCDAITGARLLAYRASGGEYIGASGWRTYDGGASCGEATLNAAAVNRATRGLSESDVDGGFRFVVEISTGATDVNGMGETGTPTGCRIRSDFGPVDLAVHSLPVACTSADPCGVAGSPEILGAVDENQVEVVGGNVLRIRIPNLLTTCNGISKLDLQGLEIKLEKSLASGDNDIPMITSAALTGGFQTPVALPSLSTGDACDLVLTSNDHDAGEDDAGEADIDGTDGTLVLRWRDSFCYKTSDPNDDACACEFAYPIMRTNATEFIVELTFPAASNLCDIRVTQVNFRVPLSDPADSDADGQILEELVCTQRPHRAADATRTAEIDSAICPDPSPENPPGGPAGADPDLPLGCRLEGLGRGPAVNPEITCNTCTEDCPQCQCPLLDDDGDIAQDANPGFPLGPQGLGDDTYNDFGLRNTLLELQYTQQTLLSCSSPDCAFTISEIELIYQCGPDRDCGGGEPLGKLGDIEPPEPGEPAGAVLVHGNGDPDVNLPDPAISEVPDTSYRRYVWNGLALTVDPGETFILRFRFDDSINGANITTMKVRFAQPFAAECQADGTPGAGYGPLCSAPSTIVLPY